MLTWARTHASDVSRCRGLCSVEFAVIAAAAVVPAGHRQVAMAWAMSQKERDETIERLTANICSMSFFRGSTISDDTARAAAVAAERKAYTAAQVAARTTTGDRPASESISTYARKLSELALEAVATVQAASSSTPGAEASSSGQELDLTGSREFLDTESTTQVLAPLLAAGSAITKVRFSTKSFGRDAAAVAAQALRNVSHCLEHADISDIVAGRPEDEALDAMRVIAAALAGAGLKHLNLSDNALGEKGVRALADAFQHQEGLEFLSLQNVGCSVHACKAVAELLVHSASLKGFHLFNNMSDNEGATYIASVLARAPAMQDFKMASSRVGPAGGCALAKALSAGHQLVRLDLSDNPMTEGVGQALAACLAQQPHLQHLNLNDTGLTNEGVSVVAAALERAAPQLVSLEMALNEITEEGMRPLAKALVTKKALQRLNLRENELEDAGAAVLSRALPALPGLQFLDLTQNQITRPGAVLVVRAVTTGCKQLQFLGLDDNGISENGVEQITELMKAAYGSDVLGSLEENDPDMGEDVEEDPELLEEGDDAVDALAAQLSSGARI